MRSSTRFGLAVCLLSVALAGCIASTGSDAELRASDEPGDILVHLLLENDQLVSAEAWWAEQAPEEDVSLTDRAEAYEALVFKNDIRVDGPQPLLGSSSQAFFTWNSGVSDTIVEPGDRFEILIVDVAEEDVIATYSVSIRS